MKRDSREGKEQRRGKNAEEVTGKKRCVIERMGARRLSSGEETRIEDDRET